MAESAASVQVVRDYDQPFDPGALARQFSEGVGSVTTTTLDFLGLIPKTILQVLPSTERDLDRTPAAAAPQPDATPPDSESSLPKAAAVAASWLTTAVQATDATDRLEERRQSWSSAQKETWAARRLQLAIRIRKAHNRKPDLALARALADAALPHAEDGRLYRAKPLTEPCRGHWRKNAPIVMRTFDRMGISIALYMRLLYGCSLLSVAMFGLSIAPLATNLVGTKAQVQSAHIYAMHTLGNADSLHLTHGITDFLCVLVAWVALIIGGLRIRAVSARLNPYAMNDRTKLSAASYTCMVTGLPRDPDITIESLTSALRSMFALHGDVVSVSVARANRALLLMVKARQEVQSQLLSNRIAFRRDGAASRTSASTIAKLEERLERLDHSIADHYRRPPAERDPSTGLCFVTFNLQREAHAAFQELRARPTRVLSLRSYDGVVRDATVQLGVQVPPPPSQIMWENLQYSQSERFYRRILVNLILLLQCGLSTYAINEVNRLNLDVQALSDTIDPADLTTEKQIYQIGTMAWTTVVIIASNLLIFLTAPLYMSAIERDWRADHRETMLAMKLLFFQLSNAFAASLSFLWSKRAGVYGYLDREWYEAGGAATVISMVLADIFFINPFVDGMRIFDVMIARKYTAPRALTQDQMNRAWAAHNPLYMSFRMQLVLKVIIFCFAWGYAFPILYLLMLLFLCTSIAVDHSGLLRTFHGLVTSSDKMYMATVTQVLPLAIVLHSFLALMTAHHIEMDFQGLYPNQTDTDQGLYPNQTDTEYAERLLADVDLPQGWDALRLTLRNPTVALALATFVISAILVGPFIIGAKATRFQRKRALEAFFRGSVPGPKAADASATADVPFRSLDAEGADPQLYLPPLTSILIKSMRDRDASQAYREQNYEPKLKEEPKSEEETKAKEEPKPEGEPTKPKPEELKPKEEPKEPKTDEGSKGTQQVLTPADVKSVKFDENADDLAGFNFV